MCSYRVRVIMNCMYIVHNQHGAGLETKNNTHYKTNGVELALSFCCPYWNIQQVWQSRCKQCRWLDRRIAIIDVQGQQVFTFRHGGGRGWSGTPVHSPQPGVSYPASLWPPETGETLPWAIHTLFSNPTCEIPSSTCQLLCYLRLVIVYI